LSQIFSLKTTDAYSETGADILTTPHFTDIINRFRRLITSQNEVEIEPYRSPTTLADLAKAILTLASISRGSLDGATFSASPDCALVTAFGERFLNLDISIISVDSHVAYRTY